MNLHYLGGLVSSVERRFRLALWRDLTVSHRKHSQMIQPPILISIQFKKEQNTLEDAGN